MGDYVLGLYLGRVGEKFYVSGEKRYVTHACFFTSTDPPAYGKISTLTGTHVLIKLDGRVQYIPNDAQWFSYVGNKETARCIAEELRGGLVKEIVDSKDIILTF